MNLLEGKTAIMTGCAGGIGAACVVFGGAIVLKLRRKEEM